ncbi:MAG: hypothetical protein ACJATP_002724, partial [Candidatus Azotimanducaceae bacterium]
GFKAYVWSDDDQTEFEQIVKQYSPETPQA